MEQIKTTVMRKSSDIFHGWNPRAIIAPAKKIDGRQVKDLPATISLAELCTKKAIPLSTLYRWVGGGILDVGSTYPTKIINNRKLVEALKQRSGNGRPEIRRK